MRKRKWEMGGRGGEGEGKGEEGGGKEKRKGLLQKGRWGRGGAERERERGWVGGWVGGWGEFSNSRVAMPSPGLG